MVVPCIKLRNKIAEYIKTKVVELKSRGISPSLAIILIGDDPASEIYTKVKSKKAEELGIKTKISRFNNETMKQWNNNDQNLQKNIEKLIIKLNKDPSIHGIIIQRPVPKELDEKKLQGMIDPKKDIDGLSEDSPFINPLVQAVLRAIKFALSNLKIYNLSPKIYNLVVVGKGKSAGSPIYNYFLSHPIISLPTTTYSLQPITQIDSKTPNPEEILKSADIIISCVGKEKIINENNISKGVILIGVGQHQATTVIASEAMHQTMRGEAKQSSSWKGDYDENEVKDIASAYTRTPGGIGPLNVIFLLNNVVQSASNPIE